MTHSIKQVDTILVNARVLTVDEDFSIAEAIAIQGDRIAAVGTSKELLAYAGPLTKVVDLNGRTVVPGLIDGHAHLDREGLKTVFPSLGEVQSIRDVQDAIAKLAAKVPKGEWIVTMPIGTPPTYLDAEKLLAEGRFPTRQELDAVAPDHPVYIRAIWGYWRHTTPLISVANTMALELAGIDGSTPAPSPLVVIEKDEQGEPTGIFRENTLMPIVELAFFSHATRFTESDRLRALPRSLHSYHRHGTTSIFEGHGAAPELIQSYRDAHAERILTVRATLTLSPNWNVVPGISVPTFIEAWCGWLSGRGMGDDMLRLAGLFVDIDPDPDNSVRARAYPSTGWAGFNYDTARPRAKALELLHACARNRIQVVAIWPNMLDLFYEVHQQTSINGLRWVLSHISLLSNRQISMIKEMGLIVTTHTNRYLFKEGHLLLAKTGPAREDEIVPLHSLLEAQVPVVLATDNVPVSLFHPFWHVVARKGKATACAVSPRQAITREQALRAVTRDAALLTWDENNKGSLEVGKLADLAVLSNDPLLCEESQIASIEAELTMVGGKVVYQRQAFNTEPRSP